MWECGCVRGRGEAWLACGERQVGRIGIVTVTGSLNLEIPKIDVSPPEIVAAQSISLTPGTEGRPLASL